MLPEELVPEKSVTVNTREEATAYLIQDFLVDLLPTNLEHLNIGRGGVVHFGEREMPFTPIFLEAAATFIEMPLQYACRIDFDLFQENFNRRKAACCRDAAINLCPYNYRPARTLDVLQGLPEKFARMDFHQSLLGDRGVNLCWVNPEIEWHPRPWDTILGGISLTNSETSFRGLKAAVFTLRLVCRNGTIMADEGFCVRWNYDPRVTYRASIRQFCETLNEMPIPERDMKEGYLRVVNQPVPDRFLVNVWRRLEELGGDMLRYGSNNRKGRPGQSAESRSTAWKESKP